MKARQIFLKALVLLDRGAKERGEAALQMAVDAAGREPDAITQVQALVCLGDRLCDSGRQEAARPLLLRALDAMPDEAASDDVLAAELARARTLLASTPSLDFKGRAWPIAEFIARVQARTERTGHAADAAWHYDVYGDDTDAWHAGQTVYVGDPVQVDDDDRLVLPPDVVARGHAFRCSGEQFQDVVDLAFRQCPDASIDAVIRCLAHFLQHDDFLDLHDDTSPEHGTDHAPCNE